MASGEIAKGPNLGIYLHNIIRWLVKDLKQKLKAQPSSAYPPGCLVMFKANESHSSMSCTRYQTNTADLSMLNRKLKW